jgi:8-hydroxy-5-deazaflavin:NADPH oxidoreductase
MQIGILGTGIVGQTLGAKLAQLGHTVTLGTRDPARLDDPKGRGPHARTLRDWLALAGSSARVGSFHDAAAMGDPIFNALSGAASLEVLQDIGSATLHGKTLIDVANPIDLGRGLPLTLFVKDTDSLGEMLQRSFPHLRVVKALNAMPAALMVDPRSVGNGDHTVFLSGNDSQAKAQVTALLREFGWQDVLDLGDISTARGTEMMLSIGHAVMRALSPARIAFKVVR